VCVGMTDLLGDFVCHSQDPISLTIGRMFACIAGLTVVLILLNKFVLDQMFRLFAVSDEMLFIGTFAYALGVSGIMALIPGGLWPCSPRLAPRKSLSPTRHLFVSRGACG